MSDLQLKLPYIPPNLTQVLAVLPQSVIEENSVAYLKPLLSYLLFGDYGHIEAHYFQQLQHILLLTQLSAQYFAYAQDLYATYLEKSDVRCEQFRVENLALKQRVSALEQRVLSYKDEVSAEQLELSRQNEQLKCEVFELKCYVKYLRRDAQITAEAIETLPECEFCGKRFSDVNYLSKHVERRHFSVFPQWCRARLERFEDAESRIPENACPRLEDSICRIDQVELPRVPQVTAENAQVYDNRRAAPTAPKTPQQNTQHPICPEITVDAADARLLQQSHEFLRDTEQYTIAYPQNSEIALSPSTRTEKPVLLDGYYGEQQHPAQETTQFLVRYQQDAEIPSFYTVSENELFYKPMSSYMRRVY